MNDELVERLLSAAAELGPHVWDQDVLTGRYSLGAWAELEVVCDGVIVYEVATGRQLTTHTPEHLERVVSRIVEAHHRRGTRFL